MLLLDTQSLIHLVASQEKLSKTAITAIAKNAGRVFVSSASAYQIGNLTNKKLLQLPLDPEIWFAHVLEHHGLTELPIDASIALCATGLPQLHADTVDRLLIASALQRQLSLVTQKKILQRYPGVNIIC